MPVAHCILLSRSEAIVNGIQKVRTRFLATPTQSATLEELVINEKGEKKRTATEGLLWLLRGLSFTCKALQNAQAKQDVELADAFTEAYGATLKQYHSFVVRPIFAVRFLSSLHALHSSVFTSYGSWR